jgi:phosphinothricin acetyltransferase
MGRDEGMMVSVDQELAFRIATTEDLPVIVEIYNSTIPGRMVTADTEPVTVEDRLAWFHAHDPGRRPLWIVEAEGEVCGWVSLQHFYGRPAYHATAEISIYLHERCRGRGLGKRILDTVLTKCPGLGIDTLLAFVFGHNEPSLRLFASAGFKRWGHLPDVAELDGVKRDLVILGRKIPLLSDDNRAD